MPRAPFVEGFRRLFRCGCGTIGRKFYYGLPFPYYTAPGAAIPGWQHMDSNCLLQPGFVIGHPASAHGHCGFVDFDGAGISAGSRCVRRTVNPWLDGTSGFNKHEMEEP